MQSSSGKRRKKKTRDGATETGRIGVGPKTTSDFRKIDIGGGTAGQLMELVAALQAAGVRKLATPNGLQMEIEPPPPIVPEAPELTEAEMESRKTQDEAMDDAIELPDELAVESEVSR